MIEDGCLQGVDAIYGAHLWTPAPTGEIWSCGGPIMAAADRFEIVIEGKGGHGGQPHEAIDPIVAASQFVVQVQSIVGRNIDPLKSAVISIGHMVASNPFNVIAQQVELHGTMRTFDEQERVLIEKRLEQLLQGLALATGITFSYTYIHGYPPVVNDNEHTRFILQCAERVSDTTRVVNIAPMMIGEDFAYYLQHVPGSFYFVGAKPQNEIFYPHHHEKFDFEERAMLHSAKVMVSAILHFNPISK